MLVPQNCSLNKTRHFFEKKTTESAKCLASKTSAHLFCSIPHVVINSATIFSAKLPPSPRLIMHKKTQRQHTLSCPYQPQQNLIHTNPQWTNKTLSCPLKIRRGHHLLPLPLTFPNSDMLQLLIRSSKFHPDCTSPGDATKLKPKKETNFLH